MAAQVKCITLSARDLAELLGISRSAAYALFHREDLTFRRADVLLETFVCLIPVVGDHNGIAALENIVAAIFAF